MKRAEERDQYPLAGKRYWCQKIIVILFATFSSSLSFLHLLFLTLFLSDQDSVGKKKKERNKGREESFSASFLLQSDASETHKLLFCCWLLALHHFQLYRLGKGRRDCIAAALVLSVVSSI